MEFESPFLRTGQADLPHPALLLVVLPPRGLIGGRARTVSEENEVGRAPVDPDALPDTVSPTTLSLDCHYMGALSRDSHG